MGAYADRPKLMAIGDSLYQGVRSLTFTGELARHSPPAQVAAMLGLPFALPDPPVPLLFDMEAIFRGGGLLHLLLEVREACLANLAFWLRDEPWSRQEAFDNISIGGAEIASLYTDTWALHWPDVERLGAQIRASAMPDVAAIGRLWYALNVCFTLNPRRREEQARKTQLDQVADRRPQALLVNIGSNEGLFSGVVSGRLDDAVASVGRIPARMAELAEHLAGLPEEVETIVFNSLVRPRCASNLMTRGDGDDFPEEGYFDSYFSQLTGGRDIPGARVQAFDELIHDVNRQVEDLLRQRLGGRLRFVDLYAVSTAEDGKHFAERFIEVQAHGRPIRLRNKALNIAPGGLFVWGGLTGLDNMHPTVPGYALIADAVLAALGRPDLVVDKQAAWESDTLLARLPASWLATQLELSFLGLSGVFSGGAGTEAGTDRAMADAGV